MKTTVRSTATRRDELDQLLQARRWALQTDLQARVHDGRALHSPEVRDIIDLCDVGIEEELSFALLQMRHETLTRIETALARLGDGRDGACCECGIEISEGRLRALPFAAGTARIGTSDCRCEAGGRSSGATACRSFPRDRPRLASGRLSHLSEIGRRCPGSPGRSRSLALNGRRAVPLET